MLDIDGFHPLVLRFIIDERHPIQGLSGYIAYLPDELINFCDELDVAE